MKLYIDDIRDPKRYLTPEQADGIIWIKEWWEAKNTIFSNSETITELHFDHFMPPGNRTGTELLKKVLFRVKKFPNLKTVYVHSSDTDIIASLMADEAKWAEHGITLINNSKPW